MRLHGVQEIAGSNPVGPTMLNIGDLVEKTGGDYTFSGTVVSVFQKLSGVTRIVVENRDGLLFIFNEQQLSFLESTMEEAARKLIEQGYRIELVNPDGKTFHQKYRVYQGVGWNQLKIVITDENGKVRAMQG